MITSIKATKNLFNDGQCFTKDKIYIVNKCVLNKASLMEVFVTNDLGEPHIIGSWLRNLFISYTYNIL